MPAKISNNLGEIIISDDALANIAGLATIECYGLVGMASKNAKDGLVELLKRDHLNKGVKIATEGEDIIVDLFVIVKFGTRISTVADNIISKVKYTLESITGLKVKRVNLNIQGVRI
jgi:uncharacterized alkaline shock family protein YloU